MRKFVIIYITSDSKKLAKKIAQILVKEKLVACVNIFPIESIFRWRGKIEKEREFGIFAKTKKTLVKKVIKKVKQLHSYQIPCIISFSIENGYKKFLEWIDKSTS